MIRGPVFRTVQANTFRTVEPISRRGFAAKETKSCFPTKRAAPSCIAATSSGCGTPVQNGARCGGRIGAL